MITELARYIPNQVNAFLLDQVTFSVRNMLEKVDFWHFYPFFEHFDDVTRRHCMVIFANIFFKQKTI